MKQIKIDYSKQKVFFTSDTHFNHKAIIEYCHRPFESVEQMNEILLKNWNNTVPEDGIVFHCGDFALGGALAWKEILPKLNGEIHLILGNHDAKNFRENYREFFASVQEQLTIDLGKKRLILTHFPLLCYHGTWGTEMNIWNIHGHVHTCMDAEFNSGKDFERMKLAFPTQYDVGIDFNDYKPISFDTLSEKINFQVENGTNLMHWVKA